MPELRVARPFNVDPKQFPSWANVPGLPKHWRFGVAVYPDVDQDICDHWWVLLHTEAAIIADGQLLLQDQPLQQLYPWSNRKSLVSEQIVATLATGTPPNYCALGPLGLLPVWQAGVLEPAPFWPGHGDIPDAPGSTFVIPDAGVQVPLTTLPSGAGLRDSAITHTGKGYIFGTHGTPILRLVALRASKDAEGRTVFRGEDEIELPKPPDPFAHWRIKPNWVDDPEWRARQLVQANAAAARACWTPFDGPTVVYVETLPQPLWRPVWAPVARLDRDIPPVDPIFAMLQRANADYAAAYIKLWEVPEPPASERYKPHSSPFYVIGLPTPVPLLGKFAELPPIGVPETPIPPPYQPPTVPPWMLDDSRRRHADGRYFDNVGDEIRRANRLRVRARWAT